MLMDTNGERKTNETAGVCLFQHFKPKAKSEIFVPCPRGKNPDLLAVV